MAGWLYQVPILFTLLVALLVAIVTHHFFCQRIKTQNEEFLRTNTFVEEENCKAILAAEGVFDENLGRCPSRKSAENLKITNHLPQREQT